MNKHLIPDASPCMNPMWNQPHRDNIMIDDIRAIMPEREFNLLAEYSTTNPTEIYPGKMWKAYQRANDKWFLCWFSPVNKDECCAIYRRPIEILDWRNLMGI